MICRGDGVPPQVRFVPMGQKALEPVLSQPSPRHITAVVQCRLFPLSPPRPLGSGGPLRFVRPDVRRSSLWIPARGRELHSAAAIVRCEALAPCNLAQVRMRACVAAFTKHA